MPNISICIPAYKRTNYLRRLLDSIALQSYRDFEVIVSDDSPDDSVEVLCNGYARDIPLQYISNRPALGTPANWNAAIRQARGEWIKLMHDDDWFAHADSLKIFAQKAGQKFVFSAYKNVYDNGREQLMHMPKRWAKKIMHHPMALLSWNVIGPPSVTLVHRSITDQYDERMKWRVDIDFYVRILSQGHAFHYINEPLVKVGISESQVTNSCLGVPEVELPEGLLLLQKKGVGPLRHLLVYDAWWRIIRNVRITDSRQLGKYTPGNAWPKAIHQIIRLQGKMPRSVLRFGPASKLLMALSYFLNYRNLHEHFGVKA